MDRYGRMGIFTVEGLGQSFANEKTVFEVGLGEHDQQLRSAELGQYVALAQGVDAELLQVIMA